jgi:hypothetical protein
MKEPRKFAVGDEVKITHDGYNNFPLGTVCKIVFCGIRHQGQFRYHVQFSDGTKITVNENEVTLTNG